MSNVIYSQSQIKEILDPVFKKHNVKRAFLFGSYAKGTANEYSDINILVDSRLRGLKFFGLLEDAVTSLDKNVDMIDTSQLIPDSEIEDEIAKSGVIIYERA